MSPEHIRNRFPAARYRPVLISEVTRMREGYYCVAGISGSVMQTVELFTIGFTKKSAEQFFAKLREAGVKRLIDVRLNNISQLAGFTKKDDLRYFLKAIADIEYVHLPELAPTQELLDEYKKKKGAWDDYARGFLELMQRRRIEATLTPELVAGSCLLCSEQKPHHCHRRLVAEYLAEKWGDVRTTHLA